MLEEENASKKKKLEEVAALDGRTPEGARRWLQFNEKASSGDSKFKKSTFNFNFNLTFAEDSSFSPQLEGECNAQFSGKSS